jgi:hypothetical protein
MLRLICASPLAGLLAVAPASSQTVPVPNRQLLVGKYHFEEAGLKVDVDLNADGTARYQVNAGRADGFWMVREGRVHIYSKPGPVRLEQAGAPTRDPRVALRVVAQLQDGSPAEGLAVTWANAAGLFYMSDGKNETRLEASPVLGEVSIEREADSKGLATFVMKAGGPNSYRFTYHPSDVEPFDFQARALDAKADVLEVELGSASAKLRRVRD